MIPPRAYALVHPLLKRVLRGRNRRAIDQMKVFFPYFSARVRYANQRTRERLGIEPPPVEGYYHRLIDFASDANWGRTQPPRTPQREKAGSATRR